MLSQIQQPPIGLREIVCRIVQMTPSEVQQTARRTRYAQLRTVAGWRVANSPEWQELKGLICLEW